MSNFCETMMNQPICDCPPSDVPSCRPPHPPIPPCPPCPPKDRNTPWYGLPQWSPATTVSFLVTMNNAMMCIDSALHNLALRTGIDGVPSDLVTTVEKLELETKDLKMRISELNVDSDNFELKLANMTKSITAIQTDISTLIINTSNLDTRMTTQEMKSTQFNGTLTKLQENITSIMETVSSINEQYQQMLQEHQDIRNDINTAQLDIANLKLKDTELEGKDSELEGKITENTKNITANDKDIIQLQTTLAVTTTSVAANTSMISKLNDNTYQAAIISNTKDTLPTYYELVNINGEIMLGELIIAAIGNAVTIYSTLGINGVTAQLDAGGLGYYGYKVTQTGLDAINNKLDELGYDLTAYQNTIGYIHTESLVQKVNTSEIIGVGEFDLLISSGIGFSDAKVKLGLFKDITEENIYFNQVQLTFHLPLKKAKE